LNHPPPSYNAIQRAQIHEPGCRNGNAQAMKGLCTRFGKAVNNDNCEPLPPPAPPSPPAPVLPPMVPAPPPTDEASAVGDPHMTLASGDKSDLCCENGHCQACSVIQSREQALIQSSARKHSFWSAMLDGQRPDPTELCKCECQATDRLEFTECCLNHPPPSYNAIQRAQIHEPGCRNGNAQAMKGLCTRFGKAVSNDNCEPLPPPAPPAPPAPVLPPMVPAPPPTDEASAVGDPHMALNSGSKSDLCCNNGFCHGC